MGQPGGRRSESGLDPGLPACAPPRSGRPHRRGTAIAAVNLFDLQDRGVTVAGPMPEGVPPFTIPTAPLDDLALLVAGALGIALVSLTDTISTASVFAARTGAEVDGDREMVGVGQRTSPRASSRGSQ